jgi:hypothetical protein
MFFAPATTPVAIGCSLPVFKAIAIWRIRPCVNRRFVPSRWTWGFPLAEFLQEHGQEQGPGVVVGAVPFGEIRNGVGGVLEHPRGVGHPLQVVEPPVGRSPFRTRTSRPGCPR